MGSLWVTSKLQLPSMVVLAVGTNAVVEAVENQVASDNRVEILHTSDFVNV